MLTLAVLGQLSLAFIRSAQDTIVNKTCSPLFYWLFYWLYYRLYCRHFINHKLRGPANTEPLTTASQAATISIG
jgi:hypothetical protein